jgi:chromate transporter
MRAIFTSVRKCPAGGRGSGGGRDRTLARCGHRRLWRDRGPASIGPPATLERPGATAGGWAFAPSYGFILLGAPHFPALRASSRVRGFLAGAGPAAVGGIAGAAIPLGLALGHLWQLAVLALAAAWLLLLRRGVVSALGGAAALGVLAALAGMPMSR